MGDEDNQGQSCWEPNFPLKLITHRPKNPRPAWKSVESAGLENWRATTRKSEHDWALSGPYIEINHLFAYMVFRELLKTMSPSDTIRGVEDKLARRDLSGFPRWLSGKESACQCGRHGFDSWVRKIPWRRKQQPTPIFLPGKSPGQRNLVGYGP